MNTELLRKLGSYIEILKEAENLNLSIPARKNLADLQHIYGEVDFYFNPKDYEIEESLDDKQILEIA